jgi:RimJ/RimL family protein N-acetyltransferase
LQLFGSLLYKRINHYANLPKKWYQPVKDNSALRRIDGVRLRLRLIETEDAGYIHGLRTDARYNSHLSAVTGTPADQRGWIEQYKHREAEGREYYYVIERRSDAQRCGTVRLYNIQHDRFTWGSWILDENKPAKAALESAVLSFGAGFDDQNVCKALIDVRHLNTHATAFYRRFGATETGRDADNIYFELTRDKFIAGREGFRQIIEAQE